MMQFFIEDQEVDINATFSTLLTASIDDVKNFGTRETTLSKTIILPGTKRNDKLFGFIFNATTRSEYNPTLPNYGYNFNAAVSAKALILNGGFQQVKGTVRLLKINETEGLREYEVAIVGELGGFVAKLGANKLTDLDFSAYDHVYSIANITGSWANANAGSGYVYPLIDYGNYSTNKKDWKVGTLRPALFLKEYIEKIVSNAGYTMDFPLLATDRLKRFGIPYNRKVLTATNTDILQQAGSSANIQADIADGYVEIYIKIAGVTVITATLFEKGLNEITLTGATFSTAATLEVFIQGVAVTFDLGGNIGAFTTPNNIVYTYAGATTITTDLTVRFNIAGSGTISPAEFVDYEPSIEIDSTVGIPTPVAIGNAIKGNDLIPQNILQVDLFRSILRMFNLYVTEDIYNERHLIITPYVTFHSGIEDWSSKIDRSKMIEIQPMSELNARYYEYKFKSDNDYYNDLYRKRYNEGYGDRIYDSEFQFTNEKSSIELIFAATPLVGYSTEIKVYPTIFKRTGDIVGVGEENVDSVIRLMQFKLVTGVPTWDIKNADGSATLHSTTSYLYAGHFDDPDTPANDLNWGAPKELFFILGAGSLSVNQFSVYWSPYMAEITDKDSKLLTATVRLSLIDWYNLSFAKYKWIDGSLWRLNKVTDYNATVEDLCKAEFIKLQDKEY